MRFKKNGSVYLNYYSATCSPVENQKNIWFCPYWKIYHFCLFYWQLHSLRNRGDERVTQHPTSLAKDLTMAESINEKIKRVRIPRHSHPIACSNEDEESRDRRLMEEALRKEFFILGRTIEQELANYHGEIVTNNMTEIHDKYHGKTYFQFDIGLFQIKFNFPVPH